MNPLLEYLREKTKLMVETAERKNHDYAGGADPFANFIACEALDICSTEAGILTRMLDKFMRIRAFVAKGVLKVKDESIEDTLVDLANYCLILACYIHTRRRAAVATGTAKASDRWVPVQGEPAA